MSTERNSNIPLHVETFAEILPFDSICNHQNDARWGVVYIAEMHKLQTDHPNVFQNVLIGHRTIHKADKDENKFSGVWSDITIEQSPNGGCGKLEGLTNIKTTESAMERWYLTSHLKANVATQFLKYSGLDFTLDEVHIQDEDAVTNIIKVIEKQMTKPFCVSLDWTADEPQPLLSISNGTVATNEIPSWIKQISADGSKQQLTKL